MIAFGRLARMLRLGEAGPGAEPPVVPDRHGVRPNSLDRTANVSARPRPADVVFVAVRHEMNRQLQADSELSLADYDVLNALSGVPGERMQVSALAAQIGWERSRLSHHARRMRDAVWSTPTRHPGPAGNRNQADSRRPASDRRSRARPRRPGPSPLFEGLPKELLAPLTEAREAIYGHIVQDGTLPPPKSEP